MLRARKIASVCYTVLGINTAALLITSLIAAFQCFLSPCEEGHGLTALYRVSNGLGFQAIATACVAVAQVALGVRLTRDDPATPKPSETAVGFLIGANVVACGIALQSAALWGSELLLVSHLRDFFAKPERINTFAESAFKALVFFSSLSCVINFVLTFVVWKFKDDFVHGQDAYSALPRPLASDADTGDDPYAVDPASMEAPQSSTDTAHAHDHTSSTVGEPPDHGSFATTHRSPSTNKRASATTMHEARKSTSKAAAAASNTITGAASSSSASASPVKASSSSGDNSVAQLAKQHKAQTPSHRPSASASTSSPGRTSATSGATMSRTGSPQKVSPARPQQQPQPHRKGADSRHTADGGGMDPTRLSWNSAQRLKRGEQVEPFDPTSDAGMDPALETSGDTGLEAGGFPFDQGSQSQPRDDASAASNMVSVAVVSRESLRVAALSSSPRPSATSPSSAPGSSAVSSASASAVSPERRR